MKIKRIICFIITVIIVIAMPLTAFALTIDDHPLSVDWTSIKLYPLTGSNTINLNSADYDIVIVRIRPISRSGNIEDYSYNVYFARTSGLYYSNGYYQSMGQSENRFPNFMVNFTYDAWGSYPEYLGGYFQVAVAVPPKLDQDIELVYTKDEFTDVIAEPPMEPPDPPDPPKPDPPPMVIPPHNPWYVPWDFERMVDFDTRVRGAIGAIVNVGLAYFGVILAVYIMIRIVKGFEDRTAGGG